MTNTTHPQTLFLIDPENLAGGAFPDRGVVETAMAEFDVLAGHREGDLAYLAANRWLIRRICFDPPFPWVTRSVQGRDAADRALLSLAPVEWVCGGRFDRLVIGSGDHAFVPLATAAQRAGVAVTVIGRQGSIAKAYRLLGCEILVLPEQDDPPTTGVGFGEAA